jgi:hypothetical protein
LDNIPLHDLDEKNLIPAAAMLLALRQDALAARDAMPTAENRLRLAAFLDARAGDSTAALAMTRLRGDAPHQRVIDLQKDPRFLATAYPRLGAVSTLAKPLSDAAWSIDGSAALSQNLMYAIVRNESGFYAGAISPVGAIGLFQIMPATFDSEPSCSPGPNTDSTRKPTAASYLFDPGRNAKFWSCWIEKQGFQATTRAEIPMFLVKHHAGVGNLNEWIRTWRGRPIEHDLELQIDTFRFPATQVFVRLVHR